MAKATAFGIILTDVSAQRLAVSAEFRRGDGTFIVESQATTAIRAVLYAVMEAIGSMESYVERMDSSMFATHNLIVRMDNKIPVDGESYGLPLAMAIVAAMLHEDLSDRTCFTGVIEPGGQILAVGDIDRKRKLAPTLGFQKIVLPGSQIDLFCDYINQCPVSSIYGAVAGYFWE